MEVERPKMKKQIAVILLGFVLGRANATLAYAEGNGGGTRLPPEKGAKQSDQNIQTFNRDLTKTAKVSATTKAKFGPYGPSSSTRLIVTIPGGAFRSLPSLLCK
jgi:hypothetical protein